MPHGAVPFPFGLCRICQDKATGFHYGVATCEGCKGFFKRSIPKGDKYTCFFGGQCNITPFNRNRCKACRFQRCLNNGMAIDAVKMGRIPQVEKKRALLEAGRLQMKMQSNMDINTEESAPSVTLIHSQWVSSGQGQEPLVGRETTHATTCNNSLEWDTLTSQSRENGGIALRDQAFSASDWNNLEREEMPLKYNSTSQQPELDLVNTDFGTDIACMQNQLYTWSPGSVRAHIKPLVESSNSFDKKTGVFPTLASVSESSSKYENQFSSSAKEVCCKEPSYPGTMSPRLESNSQSNASLQQRSRTFIDALFLETATIKTEPEICDYKNTVHCDNPFSVNFGHPESANYSYYVSQAAMTSPKGAFVNKSVSVSLEPQVMKDCSEEHMEGEMCTAVNRTAQRSSHQSFQNKNCILEETNMDNRIGGDNQFMSRVQVCRTSCYSPDVIKVLMDQVGEDRIKGMKQQIMTTIAKTFGPDEYKATDQLLTSFTHSSEQQKNPDLLKESHNRRQHSFPSMCTESSMFYSNTDVGKQLPSNNHFLMTTHVGNQLPSNNNFSVTTHFENDLTSLSTTSQQILTKHLSTIPNFKVEHPSRPTHSPFGQQESHPLKQDQGLQLSNNLNSAHFSGTLLGLKDLELQDNTMDTSECSFPSNACPHAALSGSLFAEEYNGGLVRTADKASVRSGSQTSSSDKDSNCSPDPSSLDDLTMAESSMSLSTAYEKHMLAITKKHERMLDHIHNKKAIPFHPVTPEEKAQVYSKLIASIPNISKAIIGFSNDVPGFASLSKEDKKILMKRGYYDIWMLTNSKLFYGDESYLQFDDGTFYTRTLMETILNEAIVQKFISFAKKLNSLSLSDVEIAVLCAIQLTSTSHESLSLSCNESIQHINSHFVDLLVQEVSRQHPSNCSRILVDIFRLMPDLLEINLMQQEIIANFSINEPPENVEYTPKAVPLADISETDLAVLTND